VTETEMEDPGEALGATEIVRMALPVPPEERTMLVWLSEIAAGP